MSSLRSLKNIDPDIHAIVKLKQPRSSTPQPAPTPSQWNGNQEFLQPIPVYKLGMGQNTVYMASQITPTSDSSGSSDAMPNSPPSAVRSNDSTRSAEDLSEQESENTFGDSSEHHAEDAKVWDAIRDYVYTSHPALLLKLLQTSTTPVETFFSVLRVSELIGLTSRSSTDTGVSRKHNFLQYSIRSNSESEKSIKKQTPKSTSPTKRPMLSSASFPNLFTASFSLSHHTPSSSTTSRNASPHGSSSVVTKERKFEVEDVLVLWAVPFAHLILQSKHWKAPLVSLDICTRFHDEIRRQRDLRFASDAKRKESAGKGLFAKLGMSRSKSMVFGVKGSETQKTVTVVNCIEVSESYWVMSMFWYVYQAASSNVDDEKQVMVWMTDNIQWSKIDRTELLQQWTKHTSDERKSAKRSILRDLQHKSVLSDSSVSTSSRFGTFPLDSRWLQFAVDLLNSKS